MSEETLFLCERPQAAGFLKGLALYLTKRGLQTVPHKAIACKNFSALQRFVASLAQQEGAIAAKRVILLADATEKLNKRLEELDRLEVRSVLGRHPAYCRFLWPGKRESGHWQPGYLEDLLIEILNKKTWGAYAESLRWAAADYLKSADIYLAAAPTLGAARNLRGRLLYALLAARPAFAGTGLAAACAGGAFDLENERLAELKRLLVREDV